MQKKGTTKLPDTPNNKKHTALDFFFPGKLPDTKSECVNFLFLFVYLCLY